MDSAQGGLCRLDEKGCGRPPKPKDAGYAGRISLNERNVSQK